jgi:hypothetical protein
MDVSQVQSPGGTTNNSYLKLIHTERNPDSINDLEMNSIQLNCEEQQIPGHKIYHVKKIPSKAKLVINTENFKMKVCPKVRSILYEEKHYNSIYHPRDDAHAFYIRRNEKGTFSLRQEVEENKIAENFGERKRMMLMEEIKNFISKFNSIVNTSYLQKELNKINLAKISLYFFMAIVICILAYDFFFILIHLLSIFISHNSSNTATGLDEFSGGYFYYISCAISVISILAVLYLIRVFLNKEKIVFFTHLHGKREELQKEIEYWNEKVFNPYNMNLMLSETLDYVQVFYDREIVYEIDDLFN